MEDIILSLFIGLTRRCEAKLKNKTAYFFFGFVVLSIFQAVALLNCYFHPPPLLFSIDTKFEDGLNRGIVSQDLKIPKEIRSEING
jgi:hypothetical protein